MIGKGKKFVSIAIILIVIIASVSIIALTQLIEHPNPDLNSTTGLHAGDYFSYLVTGFYNGSEIAGSYNVTFTDISTSGFGVSATQCNTSNNVLNARLFNQSYPDPKGSGVQIGISSLDTPFGVKQVVLTFRPYDGWAAVCYVGIHPAVAYGFTMNAPDYHLDLVLNKTNNQLAISGNTEPISWHNENQVLPTGVNHGVGGLPPGVSTWTSFYCPDGNRFHYNITAKNLSFYVFSEGNIRSMANGGPFAYELHLTKIHASNVTGEAWIAPGIYVIYACGHGKVDDSFSYRLE